MRVMAGTITRQCRQELQARPVALAGIRRVVAAHLQFWERDALVEPVTTCLAELLSNVGKHSGSYACVVTLQDGPEAVRLTVGDASPEPPVVMHVDWFAESGRGMFLVARTADRWGTEITADGKDIWAEFDTAAGDRPGTPAKTTTLEEQGQHSGKG